MKGNEFEYFLDNLSLSTLLAKASFTFLLLSMLFYWFQTTFNIDKKMFIGKVPALTMWLTNILLATMLFLRWVESGHFPLSNLYESLLFLSWSLTSIHLFLENAFNSKDLVSPILNLGSITSPLALFTNAFATFSLPQEMQKVTVLVPALQSNWLIMHVSVMIVSYAALLSGSLLAMAFLVVKFVDDYGVISSIEECEKSVSTPTRIPSAALPLGRSKQSVSTSVSTGSQVPQVPGGVTLTKMRSKQTRRHLGRTSQGSYGKQVAQLENFTVTSSFLGCSQTLLKPTEKRTNFSFINSEGTMNKVQTIKRVPKEKKNALVNTVPTSLIQSYIESSEESLDLAQMLDNLSYRSIGLGFALLTIGIFSGAVWANEAWGSYWSWDPKETWAFVTWLVFALYLHTRLSQGWVGKESAFVATFGFLVLWFCYLGVNLFGKGLHSYGWFPTN